MGPDRLILAVAGLRLRLRWDPSELTVGLHGAHDAFLAAGDAAADLDLEARVVARPRDPGGTVLFDSGSLWRLHRDGAGLALRFVSPRTGPRPYRTAFLEAGLRRGRVELRRDCAPRGFPVYPLDYPLDELLLLHLLAEGSGVEMHACGMADAGGNGHLFVGHSGAGKSTIARLWQRAGRGTVLSDDRVVLRERGGAPWIHGTPWHGEAGLCSAGAAPLRRIHFLRHGPANALAPVEPAAAVARLFACAFVPFHSRPALAFTLEFLERLARRVPCGELTFVPDESAVEMALAAPSPA